MDKAIVGFNTEEYHFLNNTYECAVEYKGVVYHNAITAYLSTQYCTNDMQRKIFAKMLPQQAIRTADMIRPIVMLTEEEKINIMRDILAIKFEDETLKNKLLQTAGKELINKVNYEDTLWGVYRGEGKNALGVLLMELRDKLSAEKNKKTTKEKKKSEEKVLTESADNDIM